MPQSQIADRLLPGKPYPLGATWDGLGVNFSVFSANAAEIHLCIFDPQGKREIKRLALPECTDEIWHGYLPGAQPGLVYGYRASGSYEPAQGHRFNSHKLLLDPYARKLTGALRWSDALWGYRIGAHRGDAVMDRRDSASALPKAVVVDDSFNWGDDRFPQTPWGRTVIYEAHVRGISMLRADLRPDRRGTFAGLADPRFIDHLHALGATALQLLPIHEFVSERAVTERGLSNYWGYNTLAFFAPHRSFLAGEDLNELRIAIRRLHAAGIEVILDVVYNHTCEGSELGPTLSWRGLDHASYYRLVPGDERHCINDTGCGNTLNVSHPRVLQMVMDSLRYWVSAYHIDGFRFDQCATLGREGPGFDPGAGFFDAVAQDPVLSRIKLIAEPWDPGPGGYQLGNHPPGWAEWNDKFRDDARSYWRGDGRARRELAARLSGSGEMFDRRARRPWASVNYVSSHDGFTLADVVRYEQKHNEANGEDNRDGTDRHDSRNWGVEGETDDPAIRETRARVQRALLATLLFSHGTPMLTAGDEFGRTQRGNNNAYCQDNEISWLDWHQMEVADAQALAAFVARIAAIRRHRPVLRSTRYQHAREEPLPGIRDVDWFDARGAPMTPEAWNDGENDRALAMRRAGPGRGGAQEVLLLLLNSGAAEVRFELPPPALNWRLLVHSAEPAAPERKLADSHFTVGAHSVALLLARPEASLDRGARGQA